MSEIEETATKSEELVKIDCEKKDEINKIEDVKITNTEAEKSVDTKNKDEEYMNKIKILEQQLKKTNNDCDIYSKQLLEMEKKVNASDATTLHIEIEDLKNKLVKTQLQLGDRVRVVANQENQINALNNQVSSLKEVVQITKDLLNIRNMEVKHLQQEIDSMETKISQEREKHMTMLSKMNTAVLLNEDLKKEYESQLGLFKDLRTQYEKKVSLLSEENKALESENQALKPSA